jgi:glycosyltransferase involved in cell wall biosynthesis
MADHRILHLIHTPRHSGAETVVRELCLIHQEQGIKTAIASLNPSDDRFSSSLRHLQDRGVMLFLPQQALKGLERIRFYRDAYRAFSPGLIYGHSVLPSLYGRLALSAFPDRARFISVLHSANNDDYSDPMLWAAELLLARRADRVFAVSEQGAQSYRRRVPYHRPIQVVPNGSDLGRIREAASLSSIHRAEYGIRPQQRLIIQIGRLSPVKQQAFSLDALTPLLKADENVQLWFVGLAESAAYASTLVERIDAANLAGQVKLLGSREDVPALLSAADVFIMPSLQEAHCVALIEALSSGVAVVASEIEQFSYASSMPGVKLVPPLAKEQLAAAVVDFLNNGGRFQRNLANLDIRDVAKTYGSFLERR